MQELFKRQSKRVYQIAMLYLKNTSDAEDAVQSVFLKCVEKKCVFENQNHEDAWFITVTRNLTNSETKRKYYSITTFKCS